MRFVHNNGGKAIFVHQPNKDDKFYQYNSRTYQTLNQDGIVDFCCVADYRDGTMLSNILQGQNTKEEFYEEENKLKKLLKDLDKDIVKTLKFRKNLSELILKNEKNTIWRIFDDKS